MELTSHANQFDLKHMLSEYERTLIVQALVASNGHQRRAARALGILPTTLHEKMKRLGIPTRTGILVAAAQPAARPQAAAGIEAA
ncbi:MAG: helix-turn-helix domain-containing protein [Vicinamibacteria bacterium]